MDGPTTRELVREALLDAAAVLLPVDCAGCGASDRAMCGACRGALAPDPVLRPIDGLPVWSGLRYEGTARSVLLALKESGRTDAARHLAPALVAAVRASPPESELWAVPSSRGGRRRRGYDALRLIAGPGGIRLVDGLRVIRSRSVQKTLDASARAANAAGSLRARGDPRGRRIVLVDDVVTTGATLLEARRALVAAGAEVVGAAVIASTPRHSPVRASRAATVQRMPGDSGAGAD